MYVFKFVFFKNADPHTLHNYDFSPLDAPCGLLNMDHVHRLMYKFIFNVQILQEYGFLTVWICMQAFKLELFAKAYAHTLYDFSPMCSCI